MLPPAICGTGWIFNSQFMRENATGGGGIAGKLREIAEIAEIAKLRKLGKLQVSIPPRMLTPNLPLAIVPKSPAKKWSVALVCALCCRAYLPNFCPAPPPTTLKKKAWPKWLILSQRKLPEQNLKPPICQYRQKKSIWGGC